MFWVVAVISILGLIFWKIKLEPETGSFWIYLLWVLLINFISAVMFQPWMVVR